MIDPCDWLCELHELLDRLHDGVFTDDDRLRLNTLLRAGSAQRDYFITYMDVHSRLAWDGGREMGGSDPEAIAFPATETGGAPVASRASHPLVAVASYALTALVLVLGLLVAFALQPSRPNDTAIGISPVSDSPQTSPTHNIVVGRITALVNCRWADPNFAPDAMAIVVGRPYRVPDGAFVELTYNGGARIIIQGPAVYLAESADIGALSLGRASVRINQASKAVSPALVRRFAIRAPNAMMTDQSKGACEWGVCVEKSGLTYTRVFQGTIDLGLRTWPSYNAIHLGEAEWAWVDFRINPAGSVVCGTSKEPPPVFARQMPKGTPVLTEGKKAPSSGPPERKSRDGVPNS